MDWLIYLFSTFISIFIGFLFSKIPFSRRSSNINNDRVYQKHENNLNSENKLKGLEDYDSSYDLCLIDDLSSKLNKTDYKTDYKTDNKTDYKIEKKLSKTKKNYIVLNVCYNLPLIITKDKNTNEFIIKLKSDVQSPLCEMRTALDPNFNYIYYIGYPGIYVPISERDHFESLLLDYNCFPVYLGSQNNDDENDVTLDSFKKMYKYLWTIFHYKVPNDYYFSINFDECMRHYTSVNNSFANRVLFALGYFKNMYKSSDNVSSIVIVHNLQLFLVPTFVRKKMPLVKIGYFLHTPFPTSDVFRLIPSRYSILSGLLFCDVVGFQLYNYARHFISSCKLLLPINSSGSTDGSITLNYHGRNILLSVRHIGIVPEKYISHSDSKEVSVRVNQYRSLFPGRTILLSLDTIRLEKDPWLKIQGYTYFLERNCNYLNKLVFFQVLSENALRDTQPEILESFRSAIAELKKSFGPDCYYEIILKHPNDYLELCALYRAAHIAIVCPSWDGLNLIPFQYTVSQDENDPGIIVISEFTGSASSLGGIIRINPWDLFSFAQGLQRAVEMKIEERTINHKHHLNYVMNNTLDAWLQGFVNNIEQYSQALAHINLFLTGFSHNLHFLALDVNMQELSIHKLLSSYDSSTRRLFVLDYDGTLNYIIGDKDPMNAVPHETLLRVLKNLCENEKNTVFIVSGRRRSDLYSLFASINNLGLAAEKGAFLKWPGKPGWATSSKYDISWKEDAHKILSNFQAGTDGSFIEDKELSLVWHFENTDIELGRTQALDIQKYIAQAFHPIAEAIIYDSSYIVEIKPKAVGKAVALRNILKQSESEDNIDFMLCVGDDKSDEEIFECTCLCERKHSNHFTCCIGIKPSKAHYWIQSPRHLIEALSVLARIK